MVSPPDYKQRTWKYYGRAVNLGSFQDEGDREKEEKKNHALLSHGPRKLACSAMEVSKQLYLGSRVGGSPKKQWEARVLGKICLGF